jgi:probable F420-dependent oxidoreductase
VLLGVATGFGTASGPSDAAAVAEAAEDRGFDSLWVPDHVAIPVGHRSTYPYARTGDIPIGDHADLPDPLVWLAFAAARTTTLLLAAGAVVLPQRHPLVLAKQAATLDRLSGGRLLLGVGLGWLREEAELLGVEWDQRGQRATDAMAVLRAAWSGAEAAIETPTFSYPPLVVAPAPSRPGGPPLIVAGGTMAAAERAGRLGDGLLTFARDVGHVAAMAARAREVAAAAGRDPDALEVTAGASPSARTVERLAAAGVDRVVFTLPAEAGDRLAYLDKVASRMLL